jgi:hypothetical protein
VLYGVVQSMEHQLVIAGLPPEEGSASTGAGLPPVGVRVDGTTDDKVTTNSVDLAT